MAFIRIALISTLVVAAFAEPLRYRRQAPASAIIVSTGAAAAEGQASANDAHNAAVVAIGIPASSGSGWGSDNSGWGSPSGGWGSDATPGVPASIVISNGGISEVGNEAAILEVTSNDGVGDLAGLQVISVENIAVAGDSLDVLASGGDVAVASDSVAGVQGSGASAAAGNVGIYAEKKN